MPGRHREHATIVAVIESADTEAARTAASAHILETIATIQRTIERTSAPAVA